jgi:hypothetical protein
MPGVTPDWDATGQQVVMRKPWGPESVNKMSGGWVGRPAKPQAGFECGVWLDALPAGERLNGERTGSLCAGGAC